MYLSLMFLSLRILRAYFIYAVDLRSGFAPAISLSGFFHLHLIRDNECCSAQSHKNVFISCVFPLHCFSVASLLKIFLIWVMLTSLPIVQVLCSLWCYVKKHLLYLDPRCLTVNPMCVLVAMLI